MTREIENIIPPMIDDLGRYWEQPDRSEILVDNDFAMMSQATFEQLGDYSSSQPSGVYSGKMWRCNKGRHGWYLRWYGLSDDDGKTLITPARAIVIV